MKTVTFLIFSLLMIGFSGFSTAQSIIDQPDNVTICPNDPTIFFVGVTGTGTSYKWQISIDNMPFDTVKNGIPLDAVYIEDSTSTSSTLSVSGITFPAEISYRYQVKVFFSNGSMETSMPATLIVTLHEVFINAPQSVCAGKEIQLNDTGTGSTSWSWTANPSSGNFNNNTLKNPTFTPNSNFSGDIVFSVTATGPCGQKTDTKSVTVNPTPVVNASALDLSVCIGTPINLTTNVAGLAYDWSGPNGFDSNEPNPSTGPAQTNMAGQYSVVATNSFGCQSNPASTPTITVLTPQPVNINQSSIPSLICSDGNPFTITGTPTGGIFSGTPNTSCISSSGVFSPPSASASNLISYKVTDGNGCSNTATATVNVSPKPSVEQIGMITACLDSLVPMITFNFTPSNATATWVYSLNIGNGSGTQGPAQKIDAFKASTVGDATVTVKPELNGCKGDDMVFHINIVDKPSVTVPLQIVEKCQGDLVDIDLGNNASSFTWVCSNPAIGLAAMNTTNDNITFTAAAAGDATVTVTPKAGCTGDSKTFNIKIKAKPNAAITSAESSGNGPVGDLKICEGFPLTINVALGQTCVWTIDQSGQTPPTGLNSCLWPNLLLKPGTANFSVTVTNDGCSNTSTRPSEIQKDPNLLFTIESPCFGKTLKLTASPANNAFNYVWKQGAATVLTGPGKSQYTKTGAANADDGNYCVAMTDDKGCIWGSCQTVDVQDIPDPKIVSDFAAPCKNAIASYFVDAPAASISQFKWKITPAVPIADTVTFGPVLMVHWLTPGTYTVSVTEQLGPTTDCIGEDVFTVNVGGNSVAPDTLSYGHFIPNHILISKDSTVQCYQWGKFDPKALPPKKVYEEIPNEEFQAYGAGNLYDPNVTYWVKTWNSPDCTLPPTCATISFRSEEISENPATQFKISLHPNPNSGAFTLVAQPLPAAEYQLDIFDPIGRLVHGEAISVGPDGLLGQNIEVSPLPNGLYFAVLRRDKAVFLTRSFIIQN